VAVGFGGRFCQNSQQKKKMATVEGLELELEKWHTWWRRVKWFSLVAVITVAGLTAATVVYLPAIERIACKYRHVPATHFDAISQPIQHTLVLNSHVACDSVRDLGTMWAGLRHLVRHAPEVVRERARQPHNPFAYMRVVMRDIQAASALFSYRTDEQSSRIQ
jgi:hypothetical protein